MLSTIKKGYIELKDQVVAIDKQNIELKVISLVIMRIQRHLQVKVPLK